MNYTRREVPGFEGVYQIDNLGQVFSLKTGRMLRPYVSWSGYHVVHLQTKGKKKRLRIHSAVARVFLGERPRNHVVHHKDNNRLNNNVSNLEYVSKSKNRLEVLPKKKGKKVNNLRYDNLEWRDLVGYEGLYEVSRCGHIWSKTTGRFLNPTFLNAYLSVNLQKEGESRRVYVHRCVANAFLGQSASNAVCIHLDGDRLNNSASNLAWKIRKREPRQILQPELSKEQVDEIRLQFPLLSRSQLAEKYGVSPTLILKVLRNKVWVDPHFVIKKTTRRFSADDVRRIRGLVATTTYTAIASEYNCDLETIRKIVLRKTYKDVK